jgi:hypothetical protein
VIKKKNKPKNNNKKTPTKTCTILNQYKNVHLQVNESIFFNLLQFLSLWTLGYGIGGEIVWGKVMT